MKRTFVMAHEQARQNAMQAVKTAQEGYVVTVGEPTRNLEEIK
jgi:hypothetical protein